MNAAVQYMSQISRASLFWLLFAQIALIAPHAGGLPWWLFAVCGVCGVWRLAIYRSLLPFAPLSVRVLLVVGGLGAIAIGYAGQVSLDAAVSLLVLAFFFKLLETRAVRDMYVVIFLGYFVAATQLLYSQTLLATLYALLCCLLLTVALLALHQPRNQTMRMPVVRALRLLVQTVPLAVLLFLLFPRVPPFWAVPMPSGDKVSGVSDSIRSDDFRRLAQSRKVAFRVGFDGPIPSSATLYWRGLVFTRFDGHTWRIPSRQTRAQWVGAPDYQRAGAPRQYVITMEPSGQHWLFALAMASSDNSSVQASPLGTLYRKTRLLTRSRFRYTSWPYRQFDVGLDALARARMATLPGAGNPRARAWAQQLRRRHSEPAAVVAAVLARFGDGDYRYTLDPPHVDHDAIDALLFETRAGYCEQYASALAFVLRAAGVPARLVAGYQGGERNPFEDYLTVRELDAHAWVEAWLPGRGWVREDPTAVVAPERIHRGAEASLRERRELGTDRLFGVFAYDAPDWLRSVQQWWDAVNYSWSQWFLSYDRGNQQAWIRRWLSAVANIGWLGLVGAGLGVGLLLLGWCTARRRRRWPRAPAALETRVLLALTAGLGEPRRRDETVAGYGRRLAGRHPPLALPLQDATVLIERMCYAGVRCDRRRRMLLWRYLYRVMAEVIAIRLRPGRRRERGRPV